MPRVWNNILYLTLSSLYLGATTAVLIASLSVSQASSGPVSMKGFPGREKQAPGPVWTTRRHLPLVKELSTIPILRTDPLMMGCPKKTVVVLFSDPSPGTLKDFHLSHSGRAPPPFSRIRG